MAKLGSIQNKMTQWNSVQSLIIWTEFHWVITHFVVYPANSSTVMWNWLYCHKSVSAFFPIITIYRISIWTVISAIYLNFFFIVINTVVSIFKSSIKCKIPAILKRSFMIILCMLHTMHDEYLKGENWTFQVTRYLTLFLNCITAVCF